MEKKIIKGKNKTSQEKIEVNRKINKEGKR